MVPVEVGARGVTPSRGGKATIVVAVVLSTVVERVVTVLLMRLFLPRVLATTTSAAPRAVQRVAGSAFTV